MNVLEVTPPQPLLWRRTLAQLQRIDRELLDEIGVTALIALATSYVIWLGCPDAAVAAGAPPRSDLGGHIVALKHLIEVSIPSGHLLDWSHQWFGGYPSFYFYFPLPALLIAALSTLTSLEMAAKLVAVAAPALLPIATYLFVRSAGFSRAFGACGVVASVAFVSMTSQYIFGGNVLSSVIGEYSYAIGFAFALVYLSLVARTLRGHRHTVLLALTLAATALSHLIPTIFAVVASLSTFARRDARQQVLSSWLIGFGLSAFWTVPFLLRSPYMGHIFWLRRDGILSLFPLPVLMVLPWSIAALFALRTELPKLRLLLALALVALLTFLVPHQVFAPGRALPLWHFVVYLTTGLGIAAGLRKAWQAQQRLHLTLWVAGLVMLVGASVIQLELVRKRSRELLSSDAPDLFSYEALRVRLSELPPGRVQWEYRTTDEELIGARLPLARLPADLPSMRAAQGLLVESSRLSAAYSYVFANASFDTMTNRYWRLAARNDRDSERMRARLRQLGIDYFITTSKRGTAWAGSAPASFSALAIDSAWTVWQVNGTGLVDALEVKPRVLESVSWNAEVASWLETTTDSTPWPVIARGDAASRLARAPVARQTPTIKSALAHRRVWFSTTAVGVPHVVRVGYFPNWRAYGADGPYDAVPGFMVVIPRQSTVLLRFETTWVERTGLALSLLTALALVGYTMFDRSKSRRSASARHA